MGVIEWFLGVHFTWIGNEDSLDVHLNQAGFARNLLERFGMDKRATSPISTPYWSGLIINSI